MTAEELAANISGESKVEIPEEIMEGVKTADLDPVFQEKFGVKIADIPSYKEYKSKLDSLTIAHNELLAKSEINPFANPLVKKVNEMFANGASSQEVQKFISIQGLDFDKMDAKDAIIRRMQMENNGVSNNSIEKLYKEKYYKKVVTTDEDGEDKVEQVLQDHLIELDAVKAKEYLNSQKVALSNPQAIKDKEVAQAKAAELGKKWGVVTKAILGSTKEIPLNLKDEEKGIDYSFKYAVPKENLERIEKMLIQNAVSNGMELTEKNAQALREQAIQAYKITHFDDFVNNLVMDVYAKAKEAAILEVSNGNYKPSTRKGEPPKTKRKLIYREGFA